jgi:hypothetical protein
MTGIKAFAFAGRDELVYPLARQFDNKLIRYEHRKILLRIFNALAPNFFFGPASRATSTRGVSDRRTIESLIRGG